MTISCLTVHQLRTFPIETSLLFHPVYIWVLLRFINKIGSGNLLFCVKEDILAVKVAQQFVLPCVCQGGGKPLVCPRCVIHENIFSLFT